MNRFSSPLALASLLVVAALSVAAQPPTAKPADEAGWTSLFDGKSLQGWKTPQFGGEGKVLVKDGAIHITRGDSMSGIACSRELPKIDYEVKFEAKRTDGSDFFCSTTFPVGDSPCTFVVGGWGGTLVGLSSIDGFDASENMTTKSMEFKQNRWYRVRIRVSQAKIETWIDDQSVVDLSTKGKKISIRWECDLCKPFGISTWCTSGAVRDIRIRNLKPEEVKTIAASVKDEP